METRKKTTCKSPSRRTVQAVYHRIHIPPRAIWRTPHVERRWQVDQSPALAARELRVEKRVVGAHLARLVRPPPGRCRDREVHCTHGPARQNPVGPHIPSGRQSATRALASAGQLLVTTVSRMRRMDSSRFVAACRQPRGSWVLNAEGAVPAGHSISEHRRTLWQNCSRRAGRQHH